MNEETTTQTSFAPLTPYAACKVTNIALEASGFDKVLKPQMFYTYAKKNMIATTTVAGDDKVYFDGDAFKSWLDKYLKNPNAGSARKDYSELAAQYI
jgi:hypothetical protein